MGAKIQGLGVSGTPAKFAGYPKKPSSLGGSHQKRPRKRSAARFDPSDPSETFSGVFWSFPTPRKRSAACFGAFRGLGNVQRRVLTFSDPSGRLRPPAKFAGYGLLRCSAGIPDAPRGGCGVAASNVFLVPGQTSPAAAAALTPRKGGQTFTTRCSPPIPPIFAAGYLV